MPEACIYTIISPIVQDKTKNIIYSTKYRPIAIASSMSKILEQCMLKSIQDHIYAEHNQFGLKQKHGTDLCNMVLKEEIRGYKFKGSSVFVCFMDASKPLTESIILKNRSICFKKEMNHPMLSKGSPISRCK